MQRPGLFRRAVAEGLAAFLLVFFVGGAAAAAASGHAALALPAMAAVSGLVVAALVYSTGHLTGVHINPAVTVAFVVSRHFPRREAAAYIVAQLLGAVLAAGVLHLCWPGDPGNLGANATGDGITVPAALLYEVVLTFVLMFVIVAVATDTRPGSGAAIAIGIAVMVDILIGGGVSGASMNPARSFGPALVTGSWDHFWIYVVGPLCGAVLGALTYQLLRVPSTPPGSAPA